MSRYYESVAEQSWGALQRTMALKPPSTPLACAGGLPGALVASMRRLRDWLFTIPFLLSFGLILLVFDVAQRIARLFGQRPQEYVAGALQVALVLGLSLSAARASRSSVRRSCARTRRT